VGQASPRRAEIENPLGNQLFQVGGLELVGDTDAHQKEPACATDDPARCGKDLNPFHASAANDASELTSYRASEPDD
jgi:hypothetical protein